MDKIESCPTEWDQGAFHCGTAHCFAGWAQLMSGKLADSITARRDARIFLKLTYEEANYLFHHYRTMGDFKRWLLHYSEYDNDGLNKWFQIKPEETNL